MEYNDINLNYNFILFMYNLLIFTTNGFIFPNLVIFIFLLCFKILLFFHLTRYLENLYSY